jgi:hypothetical protein
VPFIWLIYYNFIGENMKKLILMIASLFLATSVASANPTAKMDMLNMNKADSSFLFNGKANVITLSGTEMKKTEGEWMSYYRSSYISYRPYRYRSYYRSSYRSSYHNTLVSRLRRFTTFRSSRYY